MSCCSTDGTCSTGATVTVDPLAVTTVYTVAGMTCGHCEQAVTKAVSALPGVTAVSVDVAAGLVTVSAAAELDDAALSAAVDDAGYELTGRV
ncbi:heavy-metal-associated domain-containing protein [Kitasatospora sp. NPDC056184]|uniref:heavy-metal-associated domain-containing protein n=1 Tax=Kitasatospora sp. NPDC056184 TaxID=3345738 RepID=UPI0035DF59BD